MFPVLVTTLKMHVVKQRRCSIVVLSPSSNKEQYNTDIVLFFFIYLFGLKHFHTFSVGDYPRLKTGQTSLHTLFSLSYVSVISAECGFA